jgi:hypothetical protein
MSKNKHTSVKIYENELDILFYALGHAAVVRGLDLDDIKVINKLLDRLDRAVTRL